MFVFMLYLLAFKGTEFPISKTRTDTTRIFSGSWGLSHNLVELTLAETFASYETQPLVL